jgi:hypothetical protein
MNGKERKRSNGRVEWLHGEDIGRVVGKGEWYASLSKEE